MRALAERIKGADAFDFITKEIKANRLIIGWRKDINDPAANGVLPCFTDCFGAAIAVLREKFLEL